MKLLLLAILVVGSALAHAGDAPPRKPNIVYLLADDLGYGDVHCLNPERGKIKTPNIDRLASQGMVFTEAHSGASVCTPTRYGILTGRYAWRTRLQHGVLDNYGEPLLAADRLTVPAMLKQEGYHTACLGKWHLGFNVEKVAAGGTAKTARGRDKRAGAPIGSRTPDGPVTRGFDLFFGFHHARMMESVFESDRVTRIIEPVDMLPALTRRATDYVAERARTGRPFLLYFALNSPHTPIVPSKEWQGKSGLGDYGDFVMETDWAAGEVLAALDKAGIANNTLVLFTSDNGCSPAAKVDELERKGHYPSELRRGYKADIWDGGHRIPFIARWPGKIKAGSRTDQLTCLTDLMATCAEIVGATVPDNAGEDSVSMLPVLLGTATGPVREALVHHSIQGNFAIRQGEWKLELCADSGGWSKGGATDAPGQLYDMSKDIGERKNEYQERPQVVSQLTKLLEKYVTDGRSTPGSARKNDVPVDVWKKKAGKGAS